MESLTANYNDCNNQFIVKVNTFTAPKSLDIFPTLLFPNILLNNLMHTRQTH